MDLSVVGAGARTDQPIPLGTPVTVLLEGLEPLPGRVARAAAGPGAREWRLGIALQATPELARALRERVRDAARRNEVPAELMRGVTGRLVSSALRVSGRGRELLYQAARDLLLAGDRTGARSAVRWALSGDRENRAYRALLHRIEAEEALASGQRETASRAAQAALQLTPEDEELQAFAARVGG